MSRLSIALFVVGVFGVVIPDRASAQGSAGVQVTPGYAFDGVILNTVPVVTHDRRYVRIGVNPNFQTIEGFQNFPGSTAVVGGGGGGGGLPGGGGAGGGGMRSVPGGVGFAGMNGPVAAPTPFYDRPLASLASPFYDPALLQPEVAGTARSSKLQTLKAKRRKGLISRSATALIPVQSKK